MENLIIIVSLLVMGLCLGYFIPQFSKIMINRKLKSYDKPILEDYKLSNAISRAVIIISGLSFMAAGIVYELPYVIFVLIFIILAIAGTLIDNEIRIIPNEFVLAILFLGFLSRFLLDGMAGIQDSLIGGGISLLILLLSMLFTFLLRKTVGVGGGDFKLIIAISIAVGFSGIFDFLFGLSVALIAYILLGFKMKFLTRKSYFPMAGMIMAGFLFSLLLPVLVELRKIIGI